jgi:hypothetical protein
LRFPARRTSQTALRPKMRSRSPPCMGIRG